jgi:hypothetical protein
MSTIFNTLPIRVRKADTLCSFQIYEESVIDNCLSIRVRHEIEQYLTSTPTPTPTPTPTIYYTVGVGVGNNNTLAYSINGIDWVGIDFASLIFTNGGRNICYNSNTNIYVAVGDGNNSIAWSNNLLTWHGLGNIFIAGGGGVDVIWNGSQYIAVGIISASNAAISYSNDGKIWSTPTNLMSFISNVDCVCSHTNNMIIVGGQSSTSHPIIYSDNNGISWKNATGITGTNRIMSIYWNGSIYLAGGYGKIFWSDNGINWILSTGNTFVGGAVFGISSNSSICIAVGGNGTDSIIYSIDGKTNWTAADHNNPIFAVSGGDGQSVTWNGDKFIAGGVPVGNSNVLAYSLSGNTSWIVANDNNVLYWCFGLCKGQAV